MLYMRFFTLGWVKVVKIRHKNPTKNKIANLDSRKDFGYNSYQLILFWKRGRKDEYI